MSKPSAQLERPVISQFKYFNIALGLFVAVLITSNIVSTKVISLAGLTFVGGAVLFPLAYILGDVFTEVYGYAKARSVIWVGLVSLVFLSLALLLVGALPAAPFWPNQAAYQTILGFVPRLVLASICGYVVGEFINSYVLAKMKVYFGGKKLWARTIGSSILGQGADTVVFCTVAFAGVLSGADLTRLAVTTYVIKLSIEVLFTPVTYAVVGFLKRAENIDPLDTKTDFNPFASSSNQPPSKSPGKA